MYIINIMLLCIIFLMMYSCFQLRSRNIFCNGGIILITYLLTTYLFLKDMSIFSFVLILIIYSIYILVMFQWDKKIWYMICIPLIVVGTTCFIPYSLNFMNHLPIAKEQIYTMQFIILLSFTIIMFIIFIYFIRMKNQNIQSRIGILIMIICIFPMYFIFEIYCIQTQIYQQNKNMYISIFGILLSNYFIIYILYKICAFSNAKDELQISKNREDSLIIKYTSMKQNYQNQFEFVHHLLHQCNLINSYMENEEYQDANEELQKIYDCAFTQFNLLYSNSTILNYIIAENMDVIQEYHICIRTTIDYNDFYFLTLTQQMELFDLLLQYAIYKVKMIPNERIILWKMKKKNNQILLQCSYTSDGVDHNQKLYEKINKIVLPAKAQSYLSYDENTRLGKILIVFSL